MRPGLAAEGQAQLGRGQRRVGQPVGTADQERRAAPSLVAPMPEAPASSPLAVIAAALVQGDHDGARRHRGAAEAPLRPPCAGSGAASGAAAPRPAGSARCSGAHSRRTRRQWRGSRPRPTATTTSSKRPSWRLRPRPGAGRHRPELLDVVEGAGLGAEQVDEDVAGVDQDPGAGRVLQALARGRGRSPPPSAAPTRFSAIDAMCRCEVPVATTMKSASVVLPSRSTTAGSMALSSSSEAVTSPRSSRFGVASAALPVDSARK